MRRTTKIAFAIAGLLGLSAGGVLGSGMAKELDTGMQYMRGAHEQLANFAARQFMFADDVHARGAVLLQIEPVTKLEQVDQDGMKHWDIRTGYARLAIIERKAGHNEGQQQALAKAWYWHGRDHPQRDLTDGQIEDSVATVDKLLYKVPPE